MAGLGTMDGYRDLQNMGLDPNNTNIVTNYGLRALSITGQATLRGAIQELVGGHFRDGFTQGIAQGLAGELTRFIDGDIAGRLARDEITPTQARALSELSRFTGSALRAAANPNDPMSAFAQDYLAQLLGPGGAGTEGSGGTDGSGVRVTGTVFDDDGNLMPGIVNPNASINVQQQQLRAALIQQGMDAASIEWMVDYQTEKWEAADYASDANRALNRTIDTHAPMAQQLSQLRAMLAEEGFDAPTIDDRVNLYTAQRQSAVELDGFENTLNSSLDPQLASTDPQNPMRIVDHKLLTLSQKVFTLDSDLNTIANRLQEYGDEPWGRNHGVASRL
jgi:hypothetical protein